MLFSFPIIWRVICIKRFWGVYFSLGIKIKILRCYTFPILLYGAEIWTLTETLSKKIAALEMWLYRRILNISYTDRVSNVYVI